MRIKHEDAVVLEAIVRRTFNCERGGMGGFVDADHFEREPFDAAIIAIAPLWQRSNPKEIEEFLFKWESVLRDENIKDADIHVCHTPNHRIMLVFGTHSEYFFCQKPHFFKNILVLKQANLPNFVVHSPKPILLIIFEIPSYFPHYLNGFLDILCTNGNFERFLKLRTAFFLFFFCDSKQRVYRRFKK